MVSEQTYADPKDARARAKAEKAYRKASRPLWKKKRLYVGLALLGLLLIIVLAAALSGGGSSSTPTPASSSSEAPAPEAGGGEAAADVVVNSCAPGDFGDINSSLTVTNSTDELASYLITISANGPDGNRVAELNAAANSIQPGQAATVDAIGLAENPPEGLTCVVANVTRLAN